MDEEWGTTTFGILSKDKSYQRSIALSMFSQRKREKRKFNVHKCV